MLRAQAAPSDRRADIGSTTGFAVAKVARTAHELTDWAGCQRVRHAAVDRWTMVAACTCGGQGRTADPACPVSHAV